MPTYEYVCTGCREPLEVIASIHDPALKDCPACGAHLRKVFGNVGVVFKGSGFYRTDSRASKGAKAPAPDAAAAKQDSKVSAEASSGSATTPRKDPSPSAAAGAAGSGSGSTAVKTGA